MAWWRHKRPYVHDLNLIKVMLNEIKVNCKDQVISFNLLSSVQN